ncbi:MAG: hypothetical protein AMS16_07590 [Planctomycetes bacterium DG_58]|nr:MAG: hypothetical protein AMS16_07590 [Planctomycetes bacterium DG_58]
MFRADGSSKGFLACLSLSFWLAASGASFGADVVVLDTNSVWRTHRTFRTEEVRLDSGALAKVDPFTPREGIDKDGVTTYKIRLTQSTVGTEHPEEAWRRPDFDDGAWNRQPGELTSDPYQALALFCVRGKFEVTDPPAGRSPSVGEGPANAAALTLTMTFQGGVVVYLNGKEVTRAFMPEGPVTPDTLAEDYPKEAHVNPEGTMLQLRVWPHKRKHLERHAMRSRKLPATTIPASMLRRGVNVLAVEVHRAPAVEAMFTTRTEKPGRFDDMWVRTNFWWNRCALETVKLTAPPEAAVVGNVKPPTGFRVWNHTVLDQLSTGNYPDPNEPLRPVLICGAKNGSYSGQVVVSSSGPINALAASAGELRRVGGGGAIPASAIRIAYPEEYPIGSRFVAFDTLADEPTDGTKMRPVWLTVHVPKDARAGDYAGTVTVRADGEKPVEVPVRVRVVDWTLPDAREFKTHLGMVQSPDSVAMQYDVPMWSPRHWRLLDETFRLLAQLGAKTAYLPIIRQTHFGNPHGMVRWIRKPDGTYDHDFSIVERYLDLVVKHLGRIPVVCIYLWDIDSNPTKGYRPSGKPREGAGSVLITELMRAVLAKRGLEKSMMFGLGSDLLPDTHVVSDLKAVAPDVPWACHSHMFWERVGGRRPGERQRVGYMATVGGAIGVFWNPDDRRHFYGWKNPTLLVTFARDAGGTGVAMLQRGGCACYRLFAEGSMISGRLYTVEWGPRKDVVSIGGMRDFDRFAGLRGIGRVGADFWPVMKGKRQSFPITGRYPETGWGTIALSRYVTQYVLAPGKKGPVRTIRFELMREALQEAEARILVQDALLDEAARAKLGKTLAERGEKLVNRRTWAFRHLSESYRYTSWGYKFYLTPLWEARSQKLYQTAADVANKL